MAKQETTRDNQNLQNTANQRSEELKPNGRVTGAGETSSTSSASSTNVDGRSAAGSDEGSRDVETFNASDERRSETATGDNRDSLTH